MARDRRTVHGKALDEAARVVRAKAKEAERRLVILEARFELLSDGLDARHPMGRENEYHLGRVVRASLFLELRRRRLRAAIRRGEGEVGGLRRSAALLEEAADRVNSRSTEARERLRLAILEARRATTFPLVAAALDYVERCADEVVSESRRPNGAARRRSPVRGETHLFAPEDHVPDPLEADEVVNGEGVAEAIAADEAWFGERPLRGFRLRAACPGEAASMARRCDGDLAARHLVVVMRLSAGGRARIRFSVNGDDPLEYGHGDDVLERLARAVLRRDRDEAIERIRAALKARSGKSWSVKGRPRRGLRLAPNRRAAGAPEVRVRRRDPGRGGPRGLRLEGRPRGTREAPRPRGPDPRAGRERPGLLGLPGRVRGPGRGPGAEQGRPALLGLGAAASAGPGGSSSPAGGR